MKKPFPAGWQSRLQGKVWETKIMYMVMTVEVEKARFRIGPGRDEVDGTEPRITNEYELEVS